MPYRYKSRFLANGVARKNSGDCNDNKRGNAPISYIKSACIKFYAVDLLFCIDFLTFKMVDIVVGTRKD